MVYLKNNLFLHELKTYLTFEHIVCLITVGSNITFSNFLHCDVQFPQILKWHKILILISYNNYLTYSSMIHIPFNSYFTNTFINLLISCMDWLTSSKYFPY